MRNRAGTEITFSFWSLRLRANGFVAYVVAFAVSAVLLAVAWRIATGDFGIFPAVIAKGFSHIERFYRGE
ncbi:MAG TPA: hypothetical protein VKC66_26635 [Xanthobacteraceae bacterium]|nr:hypothetical protein [Xanthobacteraceae bacterium]